MIDYSLIRLVPGDELHLEFGYQVKKAAYKEYIAQIWGWDEDVQRDFHSRDWQEHRPEIILYQDKPVGTITIIESEDDFHIERFYILPEFHNQGIGTYVLKSVMDKADKQGKVIKLKVLTNNPASSLYIRNGFAVVQEDKLFYYMERKPGGLL